MTAKTPNFTGDPNSHADDAFPDKLEGTCLCGAIKVTIHDAELFTRPRGHLCHCANCRKVGGTFAQANLAIEQEKVTIEDPKGVKKVYDDIGGISGKYVHRHFCGVCGSPICSVADAYEGKIVVKLGIFPRIPEPEFETFGAHRHPWQGKHPGMKTFEFLPAGKVLDPGNR